MLYTDLNGSLVLTDLSDLIDRGTWSSTEAYAPKDMVHSGNAVYVALQANGPSSVTPAESIRVPDTAAPSDMLAPPPASGAATQPNWAILLASIETPTQKPVFLDSFYLRNADDGRYYPVALGTSGAGNTLLIGTDPVIP